jgi:N-acetylmuramoyl-L-alanine amidase
MAYVGTPSMQGDPAYTLASIIQGEAGGQGQEGMRAVASVMQNRARTNFSGYGTDVLQQALRPNQFQGQATPSAASLAIARQLLAGAVQDNTGGATSYANPGASSAAWAKRLNETNALKIGDHYFTDNQKGAPFLGAGAGLRGSLSATGTPARVTTGVATTDGPKGMETYQPPANLSPADIVRARMNTLPASVQAQLGAPPTAMGANALAGRLGPVPSASGIQNAIVQPPQGYQMSPQQRMDQTIQQQQYGRPSLFGGF